MRDPQDEALELWREGTAKLLDGGLDAAIDVYSRSLDVLPTAEAYTFRGWAYSFQGKLQEAIAECEKAIETDPTFGNPYNDIGCYLMQQGEMEKPITWFEKAKRATRYEPRHFPHLNMGRLRAMRGELALALVEFQKALEIHPEDAVARRFLAALRQKAEGEADS